MARGSENLLFGPLTTTSKREIYYQEKVNERLLREVDLALLDLKEGSLNWFLLRVEEGEDRDLSRYPFFSLLFERIAERLDREDLLGQKFFPKRAKGLKQEKEELEQLHSRFLSQRLGQVLRSENLSYKQAYLESIMQDDQAFFSSALVYGSKGPLGNAARKYFAARGIADLNILELDTVLLSRDDLWQNLLVREAFFLMNKSCGDVVWKPRLDYAIIQRKAYNRKAQVIHLVEDDRALCTDAKIHPYRIEGLLWGDWSDGQITGRLKACPKCKSRAKPSQLEKLAAENKSDQAFYFGQRAQEKIEDLTKDPNLKKEAEKILISGGSPKNVVNFIRESLREPLIDIMTDSAEEEDNLFFYAGGGHPAWQALPSDLRKKLWAANVAVPEIRYWEFYEHDRPQDYHDFLRADEDIIIQATSRDERREFFRASLEAADTKTYSEYEKIIRQRNKKIKEAVCQHMGFTSDS